MAYFFSDEFSIAPHRAAARVYRVSVGRCKEILDRSTCQIVSTSLTIFENSDESPSAVILGITGVEHYVVQMRHLFNGG